MDIDTTEAEALEVTPKEVTPEVVPGDSADKEAEDSVE